VFASAVVLARYRETLRALARPRAGQTTTELGAVLVFVSIAAIAILRTVGGQVFTMLAPLMTAF
jgi:Flp pilus assembly pilin Flp